MTELPFFPFPLALLNIYRSLFLLVVGVAHIGLVCVPFSGLIQLLGRSITSQKPVLHCCLPHGTEVQALACECRTLCNSIWAGKYCCCFFNIPVEFETVSRNFFEKEINP